MKNDFPLLNFDLKWGSPLIGVDEVGRGCLAGPVYAAAVHFPDLQSAQKRLSSSKTASKAQAELEWLKEIKDSKKLSEKKRIMLSEMIDAQALCAIASASVEEIDALGILPATFLAMSRAIDQLLSAAESLKASKPVVLVDGNQRIRNRPELNQETIIKGDNHSFHIAAASIIAKTARDAYMKQLGQAHLHYGWERNMGYGTLHHRQALLEHGMTIQHRKLFVRKVFAREPVSQF